MVTVDGVAWHKRLTGGVGTLITLAKSPLSIVSSSIKFNRKVLKSPFQ